MTDNQTDLTGNSRFHRSRNCLCSECLEFGSLAPVLAFFRDHSGRPITEVTIRVAKRCSC
jgi:hypothetical protein